MHPRIQASAEIFRLNERLLSRCLAGMDDSQAQTPLVPDTNHAAFVVLHLVDARQFLLKMLGDDGPHPFGQTYDQARGIADIDRFPALDELRAAWGQVSSRLAVALERVGEDRLAADPPMSFPVEDRSVAGGVIFLAQHESYHVGQLGLLRKGLGLGPMDWS